MQVSALYRHPIKSHGREAVKSVILKAGQTMPWDRTWAVTHEASKVESQDPVWAHCRNFMIGARTPGLAGIWAQLDEEKRLLTLTHQDLKEISIHPDDPVDVARFLDWVQPLCPTDREVPTGVVTAQDRGMTDSAFPSVSIMNTASHAAVCGALDQNIEIERWRGNIWLDGAEPWVEFDWIGRDLQVGEAVLRIKDRIKRCKVVNTSPSTGVRDTETLDTLNTHFKHQDFGVYAEVIKGGTLDLESRAELI